ncbi:MAG: hypothetical protein FWE32_08790 [Oscillospiraceae bacterium]|nr:hypothetical protein [Oscillospiraceae bacterium]
MLIAQVIILITLVLMISGKVPLYLTAFIGATVAALAAGFPMVAAWAPAGYEGPFVMGLLQANGLHPVILDMLGVLLFIGIMEKVGFLNCIILKIIRIGHKMGEGPGVATAGGIAAGIIGGMTGFTQPAITGVVTGPPAVEMGVDKNRVAGILAHAGHLGNLGGFTHPTIVAVVAMTGIAWGPTNLVGIIVALSIFAASFFRVRAMMKKEGTLGKKIEMNLETSDIPFGKALLPFLVLITAFIFGVPVVMAGIGSALLVVLMSVRDFKQGERGMMEGLGRITVPLFATVAFLFMAGIVREIGLIDILVRSEDGVVVGGALYGAMSAGPMVLLLIMFLVGSVAGLVTQSNGASIPFILPVLLALLEAGVNPVAAAVAAAGGPAIMQYYLTGGPVAALSTVIPIIPGSDLKLANRFQRPSILCGMGVLLIIVIVLGVVMPHGIQV